MSAAEARLTPQQYLEIERSAETKSEFFDGEMFAMSGGSRKHSLIAMNMGSALNQHLAGQPCEVYGSDLRVKSEATGLYTYPDVTVACGDLRFEDEREDTLLSPTIVVEVLSPSTELYDRGFKFQHYQQIESLREYVLVSQKRPRVEHFQRQPDGRWLFTVTQGLDEVLALPALGCELALRVIYQHVHFDQDASSAEPRP
jgi:Uma2 family endonuclease